MPTHLTFFAFRKYFLFLVCLIGCIDGYSQVVCPTLTITQDTTVCPNTSFVLHSSISSGTIITRAWAPKHGLSDSTIANPTVTVTQDTSYTCTITTSSTTNLITNGNFSAGNTGFTSGYIYVNTPPSQPCGSYGILGCEGYYTVNTNPRNTHSQFASFGDHTTGSGQMLIVNGATSPNVDVWCQTITVQPNTNYQFSAWVTNVDQNPQPLPALQFAINGVGIGSHFSPVISPGVWSQFYTVWNSGSNTTISICLSDSSNATGGNDFAIDDISFVPICTLVDTVHITTYVKPTVTLPADTTFCDSVYRVITPIVTGTGIIRYVWQDNTTLQTFTATQPGVYWLQVNNQCAASTSRDSMIISENHSPTVYLGNDTLVCNQPSDLLTPIVMGTSPVSYQWQDGTTDSTYTATTTNAYAVNITNMCGVASDTVNVTFNARPVINTPTSYLLKCQGDTDIIVSPTPANDTAIWQDGSRAPSYQVTGSGTYWYEWSNICGVSLAGDTFVYSYMNPPAASSLGVPDTLLCNGAPVVFSPVPLPTGVAFLWTGVNTSPADTFASYTTHAAGLYILTVSNRCGVLKDSVTVDTLLTPAPFTIGQNQGLCVGRDLTLTASPLPDSGTRLLWQDGVTTTDTFLVTTAGTYTLTESNQCGSTPASVTISPLLLPTVGLDTLPVQCDKDSVLLDPTATDALSYLWSTGSTQPSIYITTSGSYYVTVTNQCGTADTGISVIMRTSPVKPYDNAVIDSCSGAHIILNAQNPGKNFLWSNGQTSQVTTVTDSGFYYVIISDSAGYCPITDGVTVITPSCQQCQIAIPTAFSPNNDGRNDLFRVFFECQPESYLIAVYDRWGQLIYQSDNLTDGWDGYYRNIPQPIGVYTYFIHYREAGTKADKSMTGNITLLR